jgi:hypothetical protein
MFKLKKSPPKSLFVAVFLSLVEYAIILRRIVSSRKKKNRRRDQVRV